MDLLERNLFEHGMKATGLARSNKEGFLIEKDERNINSLVGYSYSKGYGKFLGFGWIALVKQDTKNAFATIEYLKIVIIAIELLLTIIVTYILLLLLHKITDPLHKISSAVTEIRKKDFEMTIDGISNDEISRLAECINKMICDLKDQRERLVRHS